MRRKNQLSQDELAVWAYVASTVRPLAGKRMPIFELPKHIAVETKMAFSPDQALSPPSSSPRLKPLAPIERRLRQRVTRGQSPIDGVLDLHGMRQDEAHRALLSFVQRKHHDGAALVMIITGKGKTSYADSERGVLKRLVPHWLADPGLRRCVIGFEDAAHHHGGTGALYVRIRRARETS
jgi:DNA-nicking Smr family endonuclease